MYSNDKVLNDRIEHGKRNGTPGYLKQLGSENQGGYVSNDNSFIDFDFGTYLNEGGFENSSLTEKHQTFSYPSSTNFSSPLNTYPNANKTSADKDFRHHIEVDEYKLCNQNPYLSKNENTSLSAYQYRNLHSGTPFRAEDKSFADFSATSGITAPQVNSKQQEFTALAPAVTNQPQFSHNTYKTSTVTSSTIVDNLSTPASNNELSYTNLERNISSDPEVSKNSTLASSNTSIFDTPPTSPNALVHVRPELLTKSFVNSDKAIKELDNILHKSNNILASFLTDKKVLKTNERKVLIEVIGIHIVETFRGKSNKKIIIPASAYDHYAHLIQQKYPAERAETYFKQGTKSKSAPEQAESSGKLYNFVRGYRGKLRKLEITKPTDQEHVNDNEIKSSETPVPVSDTLLQKVKFLEQETSPLDIVKLCWTESVDYRKQQLISDNLTVQKYIETYKSLSTDIGIHLLGIDFDCMYKDHTSNFMDKWPRIGEKIIQLSQSSKKVIFRDCLEYLNTGCDRTVISLLLLPLFFNVYGLKSLRLTKREVQDSFIRRINKIDDLQGLKDKISKEAVQFKLTIQPYIVLIGPLTPEHTCLIVMNNVDYPVDNITLAVSLCFKSYWSLHCKYPTQCQKVWQFIQKYIFNLDENKLKLSSDISELITMLDGMEA